MKEYFPKLKNGYIKVHWIGQNAKNFTFENEFPSILDIAEKISTDFIDPLNNQWSVSHNPWFLSPPSYLNLDVEREEFLKFWYKGSSTRINRGGKVLIDFLY